jgi:lipid-binding SYLF domain-containing protein
MKRRQWTCVLTSAALMAIFAMSPVRGQGREASLVDASTAVLNEFMAIPAEGIPRSMISSAEGLVIIPGMFKLGFVAGVRHGNGIVVIRDQNGAWGPPNFVTMTGGSVGWQVGVQATDVILVFKTRKSVAGLLNGKFTIGADAAAAAGPVGRQASAATDAQLRAEILSYSRSRGLFAGVSLDGSALQVDHTASQNYYRQAGMNPDGTPLVAGAQLPPSAGRLLTQLATYSGGAIAAPSGLPPAGPANTMPSAAAGGLPGSTPATANPWPPAVGQPSMPGAFPAGAPVGAGGAPPASQPMAGQVEATRQNLVASAKQLGSLLDDQWRGYLALPTDIFTGAKLPSPAALDQTLMRFESIARDPRYQILNERNEFKQVLSLLQQYKQQVSAFASPLGQLPAPPNGARR